MAHSLRPLCLCGESQPHLRSRLLWSLLVLILCASCARTPIPTAPPEMLTISGSSAMAPLLTRLAARFQQVHPSIVVTIDRRDSALGLADVVSGRAALGAVSAAPPEGMWAAPIAVDGIAIIVHPDNPLTNLTLEQLQEVFSGRVWQWHELDVMVAGDEIQVVSREDGSGTRLSFEVLAMRKDLLVPKDLPVLSDPTAGDQSPASDCPPARLPDPGGAVARVTPTPAPGCALDPVTTMAVVVMDSQAVIEFVSQHPGAIAYVSRGYLRSQAQTPQWVSTVRIEGVPPDVEQFDPSAPATAGSRYPLTHPFFLVALQEPAGAARLFVDFCLSPQGQAIVAQEYAPVRR